MRQATPTAGGIRYGQEYRMVPPKTPPMMGTIAFTYPCSPVETQAHTEHPWVLCLLLFHEFVPSIIRSVSLHAWNMVLLNSSYQGDLLLGLLCCVHGVSG